MIRVPLQLAVLSCLAAVSCEAGASQNTPVEEVIAMLSKMKATGKAAMEAEKKTYKEYSEWVDDTVTTTKQSITTEKNEIEKLLAYIAEADNDVANLGKEVAQLEAEIGRMEADKKASTSERTTENEEYMATQQDYSESVDALERAIQTLKQQDYDRPQAMLLLQKMALKSQGMRRVLAAFLQHEQREPGAPEVAAYEFQSSNIISMLEGLLDKFKGQLADVENAEANAAHAYDLEQLHLSDFITKSNSDLEDKQGLKASRTAESSAAKGELAETRSDLAADEKLLKDTETTFAAKTSDFQANQEVRKAELEAIGKAIEILSSPEVADSYATHVNLLQLKSSTVRSSTLLQSRRSVARTQAIAILKAHATALSSKLLADAAARIAESPFTKVITMIEDLLAKLKEEAAAEADHKSWCDGELKKNKLKREKKTTKVGELSAEVEEYDSSIASMAESIKKLLSEIDELTKQMADATEFRQKEKAENLATIADAKAGAAAVKKALVILKEFYASQSALVQTKKQVPELAPYKGMQDAKGGVVGMLEVIQSDFARLEADTTAEENQSADQYESLMAESKASKKQKHEAEVKLSLEKDQAEFEMSRTKKDLGMTQGELDKANEYYAYLKPQCLVIHVDYEERVARREEEIQALKEAYKILDSKSV